MPRSAFAIACLFLSLPSAAFADDRSERAAAEILQRRLKHESPEELRLLGAVQEKDVIVVGGTYDHIEDVLRQAKIRHRVIAPEQVASTELLNSMIVMVDCPGTIGPKGLARLERFVRAGGLLYTTDWALTNVIERAFPGTVRHNGGSTGDHVVPVEISETADDMMSRVLLTKGSKPQWWLEGASYPITIVDPTRVRVIASSKAMAKQYGAGPVVVRIRWHDGEIIHVVSHFYRQVATQGPAVAAASAVDSMEGLSEADKKALKQAPALVGGTVGDVESSYAFQRMTANIVTGKQRANVELDAAYDMTVDAPTPLAPTAAAPAPAPKPDAPAVRKAAKVKVLGRSGTRVQVRDDAGNEGWVDEEQLRKR